MDEQRGQDVPGERPGRAAESAPSREPAQPSVSPTPEWAVPGVDRPSPLSQVLAQLRSGVVAARRAAAVLGDVDCRDGVREVDGLLGELECFWLELVADLDSRPGAVPGVRAGSTALSFLTAGLNRSYAQAKKDVAAAKAIARPGGCSAPTQPDPTDAGSTDADPTDHEAGDSWPSGSESEQAPLASIGAAFGAGEITRAHVDVAVRCLEGIPRRVLDAIDETGASGQRRVDRYLTEQSRNFDPVRVARLAKELIAVLDPDKEDTFDPEAYLRRKLTLCKGSDEMTVGSFQLDPAGAAWVRTALAHFAGAGKSAQPQPGDEQSSPVENEAGQQETIAGARLRDERSQGQRYADALVEICRLAMDADPARTRREPPHVLIVTTPEQLADAHARRTTRSKPGARPHSAATPMARSTASPGLADAVHAGSLSPATLARLTCDAILQAVVLDSRTGAALNLGRSRRTATLAQRKALAARDRGCIIPGCHAPPGRCDAHHVQPWSLGGRTDIDGLVLLCEAHHTQLHLGLWTIVTVEGIPHIEPPPWHRLAGAGPLRNRLHDAVHRARQLAQQLRFDIQIDDPGLNDPGFGDATEEAA